MKALVLAGPVLFFPFSRSYYAFYVFILGWALWQYGLPRLWQQSQGPRLALYTLGAPVLVTLLGWLLFQGGGQSGEWLGKAGVVAVGALLCSGTIALSREPQLERLAGLMLSVAVASWVADGMVNLVTGHSLDCRGAMSACATDDRFSLYFGAKSKLGYVLGLLPFLPACWLISQRRMAAGLLLLLACGLLSFAAASRFSMLSFLVGSGVLALVLVLRSQVERGAKFALLIGMPLALACLAVAFYHLNGTFQSRVDATLLVFKGQDYATLNAALSGRLDIWLPLLDMLRDHWIIGVGPGTLDAGIRPYLPPDSLFATIKIYHAHQVILDVVAATGVIGLAAFLAFYGWVLMQFLRATRAGINLRWGALLVLLLMWFPLNSPNGFYASEMMLLTFYLLGLGLGFQADTADAVGTGAEDSRPS